MTSDVNANTAKDNDLHANDAAPYAGGDPYADYRAA